MDDVERNKVTRRTVTAAELRLDVDRVLAKEGMTYEQFVDLGARDELQNPRLRDLWLLAGPALVAA